MKPVFKFFLLSILCIFTCPIIQADTHTKLNNREAEYSYTSSDEKSNSEVIHTIYSQISADIVHLDSKSTIFKGLFRYLTDEEGDKYKIRITSLSYPVFTASFTPHPIAYYIFALEKIAI